MLSKIIHTYEKMVTPLNFLSSKIASLLLLSMMLLTFGDVTGRYFWRPILGAYELTYLWLALMVFLSLGHTQQKKGHISIGVLIDRLSVRGQAIADLIIHLVMLVTLALMSWQTYEYAQRVVNTITSELNLPVYIFVIISAIGIIIFTLTVLLDLLKALQKVVDPHES